MDIPTPDLIIPTWSWGDSWLDLLWVILAILSLFPMMQLRGGASRVFFDIVGVFQADRMLQDANAKQAAFNAIMLDGLSGIQESFQMLGENIQMFVDSWREVTFEVADARIEFEKFVQEGQNVNQITKDIIEMGETYGYAADQSLAAGARMAQLSGIVGSGAMGAATEVGIKFALIGGMETEAAMTRLINLQQQTGFMYGDLTRKQYLLLDAEKQANEVRKNSMAILDQLNTIENRSAATMSQITYVMNQFASQAHMTGESIGAMAAQSAVLIEAGEEQGKAGRALKMIYARLGANTNGAADTLRSFGIATHDSSGNLRSLSRILKDLGGIYGTLEDSQKQAIAQSVAGNNHYVRFLKLAANVDRAQELQIQSLIDQAKAQTEVDKRLEENVTAYRQAEASLKNYRAELGNELLPALTSVTEAQARMTSAVGDLVGTDLGGFIGKFTIMAQQYGKIAAGPLDMYINLMQLKVAMMTQRAIMDAMAGKELVRKDVFGRTNTIAGAMTGNLQGQHYYTNLIFVLEKMRNAVADNMNYRHSQGITYLKGQKQQIDAMLLKTKERLQIHDWLVMAQKEGITIAQAKYNQIEAERRSMYALSAQQRGAYATNVVQTLGLHRTKLEQHRELQRSFDMLSMQQQGDYHESIARIHARGVTERAGYSATRTAILANGNAVDATSGRRLRGNLSAQAAVKKLDADIQLSANREHAHISRLEGKYKIKGYSQIATLEAVIKKEQEYLMTQMQYLELEIQRKIATAQRKGDAQEIIRLTDIQTTLTHDLNAALGAQAGEEGLIAAIESALVNTKKQLNFETQKQGNAAMGAAGGLGALSRGQIGVGNTSQTLTPKMNAASGAMSRFSMMAGMGSMAMMMFGDSKHAARASVILMIASMAPMIIQSMTATAAIQAQTAANVGLRASQELVVTGAMKVKAALITTGIGAAIVAVGYGISLLGDALGWFDENEDSIEDYGHMVGTITESTIEWVKANEDLGMGQIVGEIDRLTHEYNRLEGALEGATGATADLLNTQKQGVADSLGNYQALQGKTFADAISSGELTEAQIEEYFGIKDFESGVEDWKASLGGENWFSDFVIPDNLMAEIRSGDINTAEGDVRRWEQAFKSVGGTHKEFFDWMEANDFEDPADLYAWMDAMGYVFEDAEESIGSMTSHLTTLNDTIYEFSNSREELFFGFASGNLTGDLMKQVINEGVENLINQTEVIMTNNFNGMTTEQVAQQILDKVEEEAGLRGINLSSA